MAAAAAAAVAVLVGVVPCGADRVDAGAVFGAYTGACIAGPTLYPAMRSGCGKAAYGSAAMPPRAADQLAGLARAACRLRGDITSADGDQRSAWPSDALLPPLPVETVGGSRGQRAGSAVGGGVAL